MKWEAYKRKIEMQTGENFDELANTKMSPKEIDNNMMEMLGEMEPTVPNKKRQKETEAKINPVTGEKLSRFEAR